MKTLEELFKELNESKELQAELQAATDAALEAFLKQHGCEASAKEFFDLAAAREGELSDAEAANAAGGFGDGHTTQQPRIKPGMLPL